MNKVKGFTLVEMVGVIVILGILSVIAVSRFLHFSSNARISGYQGLSGAINSAIGLTYGMAALKGVEKAALSVVSINGVWVKIHYGYPTLDSVFLVVDGLDTDWKTAVTSDGKHRNFSYEGFGEECRVTYTEATEFSSAYARITQGNNASASGCDVDLR